MQDEVMESVEMPRQRGLLKRRFADGEPTPPPPRRKFAPGAPIATGPTVGERLADPPEAYTFGDLRTFVEEGVAQGWDGNTRVGVTVLADVKQDAALPFETGTIMGLFKRAEAAPVEVIETELDPETEEAVARGLREMQERQAAMGRKTPGPTRW